MSAPRLSGLGMGTAAIGNLYAPVADAVAIDAVHAARGAGIGYFDTAPYYGFGLAERRLGEALAGEVAIISTKVGRVLVAADGAAGARHGFVDGDPYEPQFDYSADGVRRSYDASLARLRRDRVEILLAHDLGVQTHGAAHAHHLRTFLDSGYPALRALRDAGAVDAIGIGVNEIAICLELLDWIELDVILLAGRYTLLDRSAAARLIDACARRGVQLVIGGPYNSGILAQDDLAAATSLHYDYAAADPALVARALRLERLCAGYDVPLPAAALQFPLRDPRVAAVIAGFADRAEVAAAVARAALPIPDALWQQLAAAHPLDQAA